ncbi:MAG: hypothetical protein QGF09_00535 [Rhodospirillales bacterium]|jgi:hypothetical protein|nr:hypothetical protein [Rhodospirillales bacterium]
MWWDMLKRFRQVVAVLGLTLALAACDVPVAVQKLPQLTFRHLAPIPLNVVDLQVANQARPPMTAPHMAHLMPAPPAQALKRWAEDRLRISGRSGTARFTILSAEVTETRLAIDKSVTGLFKKQQSDRYDGKIEATLEIFDDRGTRRGRVTAQAFRSLTMAEDLTLVQRRRKWFELVEAMMGDFNTTMERNISSYLTEFLR